MSDYSFIAVESATEPVATLCRTLDVAQSSYYAWKRRGPSERKRRDAELFPKVNAAFANSGKTYGSPRIHDDLREAGEDVGRHRVARLMRENALDARPKRKFRVCTTDSNHDRGYAPNLVAREFVTDRPDKTWVGDVTYIDTDEGWVYLAAITDLFSRRVVGWHVADHKRDELSIEALRRAFAVRHPSNGLVVHTDRGSEFASKDFRALLAAHGALPSMSRKADCYDNAVAESFFATLEKDLLLRTRFRTRREAIAAVNHYIQNFYNPIRKHSHNGNQSPERAEQLYAIAMRAVAA